MNAYCLYEEYNNGDDALEAYPVGLSQIPRLCVMFAYKAMSILSSHALILEIWRCQNLWDLFRGPLRTLLVDYELKKQLELETIQS